MYSDDGSIYVIVKEKECCMNFGSALLYDHSGENNCTRGKPPVFECQLVFNDNQQPKIIFPRNHPRVLQEPYIFHLFGANNDTQPLLINASSNMLLDQLQEEGYTKYFSNLLSCGMAGLEHHNGAYIVEEYITGYSCKGNENSANWVNTSKAITNEYCSRPCNQNKTIHSLVAKHMNEISGLVLVPKDQAAYLLSGGVMKRNSFVSPLKCLVNSIHIDQIGDDRLNSSFQWPNIERKCKSRPNNLESLNVYCYCAFHWTNKDKPIVPHFFGFNDDPSWPLKENYLQWMLTLFKPWHDSIDALKHSDGSFSSLLEMFMYDPMFPARKLSDILRCKLKIKGINSEAGESYHILNSNNDENTNEITDVFDDVIENKAVCKY